MFVDVHTDRLQAYTDAMAKGMEDKLFFLPHLPAGAAILDFGCADGRMLEALAIRRPDLVMAGLDISQSALDSARARGVDVPLFASTDAASDWVHREARQRPVVLVANSVVHEVVHYGPATAWLDFWSFVQDTPFWGMALRDFSMARSDAAKPAAAFARAVRAGLPAWQRASFESLWGPIVDQGRAVHAALKAPWTQSWDREGPENYFPIFREAMHERVHALFTPVVWNPHVHAYADGDTVRRFGRHLPCATHLSFFATR